MSILHRLLYLHLITELHHGEGSAEGVIDRPLRRERKTKFPLIQGSSIKGVIKASVPEPQGANDAPERLIFNSLFGAGTDDNAVSQGGSIAFGDANLLAFPIRSLQGLFVWATCPTLLHRFHRFLKLTDGNAPQLEALFDRFNNLILVLIPKGKENIITVSGKVFLEEYAYEYTVDDRINQLSEYLSQRALVDAPCWLVEQFKQKLVILPEDDFRHFANHATEVTPNIRIDQKTGTADEGGLRYTEYLPSETLMYCLLSFDNPTIPNNVTRSEFERKTCLNVSEAVLNKFKVKAASINSQLIQLGGDETIGKGLVKFRLWEGV